LLEVDSLRAGYGRGPDVLHGASLSVADGEMVSLIGLNGAGKSTTVRAISGLLPTRGGAVTFDGTDLTRLSTDARARLGVVLVPEGRELCPTMTVEENLQLGSVALARAIRRRRRTENFELIFGLFPILATKRRDAAGSLSGGQQQMVAIGRALMASPELLILDEPSLGLAPLLVREIFDAVRELNRSRGLSVLVVEQNAAIATAYTHRAYHVELGAVRPTTSSDEQRSLLSQPVAATGDARAATSLELPDYRYFGRRRPAGERA
jgi:branched-chain amino acid transport system ATP-binding protein